MDEKNPLNNFLTFFEAASENIRYFSKLYEIGRYDPLGCYWEDLDMIEEDDYAAISKEDFLEAERLNKLFSELTPEEQYKSRIKQYQCWMCNYFIHPTACAFGITVYFENDDVVIKELDCIQCLECSWKYQLDENRFTLN